MKYVLWSFALIGVALSMKFWYIAVPLMMVGAFMYRFTHKSLTRTPSKSKL